MSCPGSRTPTSRRCSPRSSRSWRICGWEKVIPVIGKDAIGTKVYDLEPGMIFTLADGERDQSRGPGRIRRAAGIGLGPRGEDGRLRGYADLWDPSTGQRQAFEQPGAGDLRQRGALPVRHEI